MIAGLDEIRESITNIGALHPGDPLRETYLVIVLKQLLGRIERIETQLHDELAAAGDERR